ncbi:MAG TPA: hypothetical protein ENK13_03615, partial [Thermopetrobacter sp.]|nr:hypothetical protein [Thermopetrobacter sp.]
MNGERPDEGGERDGPAPEGGGNGADGGARRPPGWIPPTRAGANPRGGAEAEDDPPFGPGPSAPAINLPLPVLLLIVAFVVVHGVIHGLLAPMAARYVTLTLAFLPMRYALPAGVSPGDLP